MTDDVCACVLTDSKLHFKMLMCFDDSQDSDVLQEWIEEKFSKGAVPPPPMDERVSSWARRRGMALCPHRPWTNG